MFSGYIDLCESLPSVQINNSLIAQMGNNDFVAEAKSAERPNLRSILRFQHCCPLFASTAMMG